MKKKIIRKDSCRNRGFTLVELLLYMGLLTILVTIMSSLFKTIVDVQLESKSSSSVDQDGRFIIARMVHDMQSAQTIVIPASAGSTTTTLQITENSVNYTYSLVGGNLQLALSSPVSSAN